MNSNECLMGEREQDVWSAMHEEGCLRCFGCPQAMSLAADISKRASLAQQDAFRLFQQGIDINKCHNYSDISDRLQLLSRSLLQNLTGPCKGWMDGVGINAPHPANICNSPNSRDNRLVVAIKRITHRLLGGSI